MLYPDFTQTYLGAQRSSELIYTARLGSFGFSAAIADLRRRLGQLLIAGGQKLLQHDSKYRVSAVGR